LGFSGEFVLNVFVFYLHVDFFWFGAQLILPLSLERTSSSTHFSP
jgi:hypothetical protein